MDSNKKTELTTQEIKKEDLIMCETKYRVVLGGAGFQSFRLKHTLTKEKKHRIVAYKVMIINDKEFTLMSHENEGQLIIDYRDECIAGVFRNVKDETGNHLKGVNAVVCAIWYEEKKKGGKFHFLWSNLLENQYQYAKFKSVGIDDNVIMNIANLIFSNLKNTLDISTRNKFENIKELKLCEGGE